MELDRSKVYWQILAVISLAFLAGLFLLIRGFNQELDYLNQLAAAGGPLDVVIMIDPPDERPLPRLVVGEQFPGSAVFLSLIDLPEDGWVAVTEETAGLPGEILGSAYFTPRQRTGVIELSQSLEEGRHYWVVLYRSSGNRRFSPAESNLWLDNRGQPIQLRFLVTRDLAESKG